MPEKFVGSSCVQSCDEDEDEKDSAGPQFKLATFDWVLTRRLVYETVNDFVPILHTP